MEIKAESILKVADLPASQFKPFFLTWLKANDPTYLDNVNGCDEHLYSAETLIEERGDIPEDILRTLNAIRSFQTIENCGYFRLIN